jgi:hypothetical protein
MKKIVLFLSIVFLITSCSPVDDGPNVHYETLPIEDVVVPDSFMLGETYPIGIKYYRPTSCHGFNGFYYDKELNIRTIAVQSRVVESTTCTTLTNDLVEDVLYFKVTSNGSYIFKFWQGKDAQGQDMYLEIEVPVI